METNNQENSGGMKEIIKIILIVGAALAGIILLKHSSYATELLWRISNNGTWLLPLVLASSVLDSVHPCSFSILLLTIAFLFSMEMTREKIFQIGGTYIAGIFAAYLLIGLGILKMFHLFDTPHFMGKLGAALLIAFGLINIINEFFPKFPIKLVVPAFIGKSMGGLLKKASVPASFGLGALVGICQFPCMGGPYLMVIGLLHDQMTYSKGFGYLVLYNIILVIPLLAVLWIAANKALLGKMQEWKNSNVRGVKFWAGIVMIVLGALILFI